MAPSPRPSATAPAPAAGSQGFPDPTDLVPSPGAPYKQGFLNLSQLSCGRGVAQRGRSGGELVLEERESAQTNGPKAPKGEGPAEEGAKEKRSPPAPGPERAKGELLALPSPGLSCQNAALAPQRPAEQTG